MSKTTLRFLLVTALVLLAAALAYVPFMRLYGFSDGP